MSRPEREQSRIGRNRFAFVVVVASLVVAAVVGGLYWAGLLEPFLSPGIVTLTSLPLYVIGIVVLIATVVWSWERVASFFE